MGHFLEILMARLTTFLTELPHDRLLVNAPTGMAVDTGLFKTLSTGVIAVLDPQDMDDPDARSVKALRDELSLHLGSGNDGGLAWIPAANAAAFAPFAADWLVQALERNALNLGNGPVSEAFVLYPVSDGLVVSLVVSMMDPECGTEVFDDLLEAFADAHQVLVAAQDFEVFDPTRLFWFEDCHLTDNLRVGRNSGDVDRFLEALYQRGLLDERFVLHSEAPEYVIDGLQDRKVTVTGTFGVPREDIEAWFREVGAVVTETPVANGLLVVGDKPGQAKLTKASKVGTPRMSFGEIAALVVAHTRD